MRKKFELSRPYKRSEDGVKLLYDRAVLLNLAYAVHKLLNLEILWNPIRIAKKFRDR